MAFQPGFRISTLDAFALIVGACATAGAAIAIDRWLGIAIAFVVVHFFVFCNVVRMSRPLELAWAGVFAGMAIARLAIGVPSWPFVFGAALALTVAFVAIEMRRPSYHGIGWRRINPGLVDWWEARERVS